MTEILVGDQWPLQLLDGHGGHFAYMDTQPSRWNPICFMHTVRDLPHGLSVVEYFGGVGIFATIVQNMLHPRSHYISDLDADCVRQLEHAFAGQATIAQADARRAMGCHDAELVILDFPTCNARFLEREWPTARVFARHPRYLVWSDTALRRLGWFRHLYTNFFGQPVVTYDDYIRAYNAYLWRCYGYTITRVTRNYYAYILAQPLPAMARPEVVSFTVAQL